ncbi:MAG: hypothetical protein KF850_10380 [Labilithrix sp.]|nr:hypothetical protein [Labilithrix sp.]
MCFSAEASFGAAALLTTLGCVAIRESPSRRLLAVAGIPILFAAQQASEGVLWLILDDAPFGKSATVVGRVFLFFALLIWPSYVPLAFSLIEPNRTRMRLLKAAGVGGLLLGSYLFGCASLRASDACIAFGNIYYWVQIDVPLKPSLPYVYAAFVVVPLLLSSVRGTGRLGLLVLVSFAVVGRVYAAGFVSVWCFFCAVLSGGVVLVVRCRARALGGESGRSFV